MRMHACMHTLCPPGLDQVKTSYIQGGKRDSSFDPTLAKSLQVALEATERVTSRAAQQAAALKLELIERGCEL